MRGIVWLLALSVGFGAVAALADTPPPAPMGKGEPSEELQRKYRALSREMQDLKMKMKAAGFGPERGHDGGPNRFGGGGFRKQGSRFGPSFRDRRFGGGMPGGPMGREGMQGDPRGRRGMPGGEMGAGGRRPPLQRLMKYLKKIDLRLRKLEKKVFGAAHEDKGGFGNSGGFGGSGGFGRPREGRMGPPPGPPPKRVPFPGEE